MTTEHDYYGLSPEDRAEFVDIMGGLEADQFGRFLDEVTHRYAQAWAACAKLYREKLAETEDLLRQVCEQYDTAATEVETLQIGNNALLTRVKELEAENLRAWGEYHNAQAEVGAARVQRLADIGSIKELEAENSRLRADAARLDHIESNARCDLRMDGGHVWWPTSFNHRLTGPTLRAAIDKAMKGGE